MLLFFIDFFLLILLFLCLDTLPFFFFPVKEFPFHFFRPNERNETKKGCPLRLQKLKSSFNC